MDRGGGLRSYKRGKPEEGKKNFQGKVERKIGPKNFKLRRCIRKGGGA